MRIPSSVKWIGRVAVALAVVVGSVGLFSAPSSPFTRHDKAYYLDAAQANSVGGLLSLCHCVLLWTWVQLTRDFRQRA